MTTPRDFGHGMIEDLKRKPRVCCALDGTPIGRLIPIIKDGEESWMAENTDVTDHLKRASKGNSRMPIAHITEMS